MKREPIDPVSRAVSWLAFAFSVACTGFGAWVWLETGGQDVGGIFALVFICGGILLAIPSLAFALSGKL
ncbi:MAG: hypothetical protein ABIO65_03755 [Nitrospiria bacterium]